MFSRFQACSAEMSIVEPFHSEGRFVIHRHQDRYGKHLDLRIEQDGYLLGWRLEDTELREVMWGIDKLPHNPAWLHEKNEVEVVLAGTYRWHTPDENSGYLVLHESGGLGKIRAYRIQRWRGLPLSVQQKVAQCIQKNGIKLGQISGLIEDGIIARNKAIQRICGIGKSLDGDTFDEMHWVTMLTQRSLKEIHQYLRHWEARMESQNPPLRLTKPEMLSSGVEKSDSYVSHWQQLLKIILRKN